MKKFSAHFIFTNTGTPLNRGIITTDDDGTIISIEDTGGNLTEKGPVQFFNGIITPGFVNCHCHLELSHLKGFFEQGKGLPEFLKKIRLDRDNLSSIVVSAACSADNEMAEEGVVLCADICNTSDTFHFKKESRIHYINLAEVFGVDPEKADRRIEEMVKVAHAAEELDLPISFVPHSVYSLSLPLFRQLKRKSENNAITSIHFMETEGEKEFIENQSGELMNYYKESGLISSGFETVGNHVKAILKEITSSGNLILVHNTFTDIDTVKAVNQREKIFWCLCPNSNIYIENKIPPVGMLLEEGCDLIIGTDSLASNTRLSILEELKTLQKHFPSIPLEEMIMWSTINGARALNEESSFGTIEPGKKSGLILLQNIDLINKKLLPESLVRRLI
jgi:aminodeoxyfutalosine deaminase